MSLVFPPPTPSCPVLLEAPLATRQARVSAQTLLAVAGRALDLVARVETVRNGSAADRALAEWLSGFERHVAIRQARTLARREVDELIAQSFGAADRVVDELALAFVDLNQVLRRETGGFFADAFRFVEDLTDDRPPALADAVTKASRAFKSTTEPTIMRVHTLSRVLDAYRERRGAVDLARTRLLSDRRAPGRASYFDEGLLLEAITRVLGIPPNPTQPLDYLLRQRTDEIRRIQRQHRATLANETSLVTQSLKALNELAGLAKTPVNR